MVATLVLEASAERRVGSSPTWGTISCIVLEKTVYRLMHFHLRQCLQAHVTSWSLSR